MGGARLRVIMTVRIPFLFPELTQTMVIRRLESDALALTRHGGGACIHHHDDGHHGLEDAVVLGEEILHQSAPLQISYSDTSPRFLSSKYSQHA